MIFLVSNKNVNEHQLAVADQLIEAKIPHVFLELEYNEQFENCNGREKLTAFTETDLLRIFEQNPPGAIFLPTPYPEHYPSWFFGNVIIYNLIYAGYALPVGLWEKGAYDNPFLISMRLIIAASRLDRKKLKNSYGSKKILYAGNPLLYSYSKRLIAGSMQLETIETSKVLWAPHWSQTWDGSPRGFSRFEESLDQIEQLIAEKPDITITLRPHPILKSAILEAITGSGTTNSEVLKTAKSFSPSTISKLNLIMNTGRVTYSRVAMLDDIEHHDLLVTEGVSIVGYWACSGKPFVVLRDAESPRFSVEGERIARLGSIADPQNLCSELLKILNEGVIRSAKQERRARRIFKVSRVSPALQICKSLGLV